MKSPARPQPSPARAPPVIAPATLGEAPWDSAAAWVWLPPGVHRPAWDSVNPPFSPSDRLGAARLYPANAFPALGTRLQTATSASVTAPLKTEAIHVPANSDERANFVRIEITFLSTGVICKKRVFLSAVIPTVWPGYPARVKSWPRWPCHQGWNPVFEGVARASKGIAFQMTTALGSHIVKHTNCPP